MSWVVGWDNEHKKFHLCEKCTNGEESFPIKPDTIKWKEHVLTDPSWEEWRKENKQEAKAIKMEVLIHTISEVLKQIGYSVKEANEAFSIMKKL